MKECWWSKPLSGQYSNTFLRTGLSAIQVLILPNTSLLQSAAFIQVQFRESFLLLVVLLFVSGAIIGDSCVVTLDVSDGKQSTNNFG